MDNSIKEALLSQFSAWLDAAPPEAASDETTPETDLYSLLVEMAGLRAEVRTESRLVKEALDQFRDVFQALQAGHDALREELERARAVPRDQAKAAIRPLLLDLIDLRDRLLAAQKPGGAARRNWLDRLFGRDAADAEAWREGLRLTVRRLDQVLLDRGVVALRLVGQPFDPRHARAAGVKTDTAAPDGTVIEELSAGFVWDDQVLRAAEVIVSKSRAEAGNTP